MLLFDMEELVAWVYLEAEKMGQVEDGTFNLNVDGDDAHHDLYHAAAKRFKLYDAGHHAPIWLSRVVEGIIRDITQNSMTAKNHTA